MASAFEDTLLGGGAGKPADAGLNQISPLLGTRSAQRAVDDLAAQVTKLSQSIAKINGILDATASKSGKSGSAGTLGGGKPNGGGAPIAGSSGKGNGGNGPNGPISEPAPMGKGKGNGGRSIGTAIAVGATGAFIGSAVAKFPDMVSSNTTAQMISRNAVSGSWSDTRASFSRDNYTAFNQMDANQSAVNLSRLGYAAGTGQWNAATSYNKSFGHIDPSLSAATVSAAQADNGTGASYQMFAARGMSTLDSKGNARTPRDVAMQMLQRETQGMSTMSKEQAARWTSQTGWGGMDLQGALQSGAITKDQADVYRSEMNGATTAMANGHTIDEYKAAADKGDVKALKAMGIDETDANKLKDVSAKKRNVEQNTAEGFSDGLGAATTALEAFEKALGKITDGPLGDALGGAQGFVGTMAGTATGGLVGGLLSTRYGRGLVGRGIGSVLSRGAGGAGAAATAAGEAGAVGEAGVLGGAMGGGALALGAGAAGVGAIGAMLLLANKARKETNAANNTAEGKKRIADSKKVTADIQSGKTEWHDPSSNNPLTGKPAEGSLNDVINRSTSGDGISGGAAASSGAASGSGGHSASSKAGKSAGAGGPTGASVIAKAKQYLGTPYVWGGTSPKGFDCSGLMQYVFRSLGVSLPRTSQEQAKVGTAVKIADVRPGDLVFPSDPHHVALYIGSGKILEAPRTGLNVRIAPMGTRFAFARRVLGSVGDVGAVTGDSGESVSGDNRKQGSMPSLGGNAGAAGVGGTSEADLVASALTSVGSSLGTSTSAKDNGAGAEDSGGSGTALAGGSSNGAKVFNTLTGKGFTPQAAAGVIGNLMQESGLNPKAKQHPGPGRGIMQWTENERFASLIKWAGKRDPWSLDTQVGFMMKEMNDAGLTGRLAKLTDVHKATDLFEQVMERAGTPAMANRYKYADNALKTYNGGANKGYDVGSTNVDVDQIAKIHKGEMIFDAQSSEAIRQALSQNTPTKGMFGGKGGASTVLQFNQGSIVLQASGPMNDSQATDFAKSFVRILANDKQLQQIAQG